MEYYRPEGIQAELKSDRSVITEADLAADRLISEQIHAAYPKDAILSEEADTTYPALERATWVIDPLDGTANFAAGIPVWGVSIARVVGGQPETAALYYPVLNELYGAQRGQGAWLNGQPLHTKTPSSQRPTAFFTCCTRTHRHFKVTVPYKVRILGAASYTFCTVARGAAPLGFQATPKLWDLAAGWLVVQEAGGHLGTISQDPPFPLVPGQDYDQLHFPTFAAADAHIAEETNRNIVKNEMA